MKKVVFLLTMTLIFFTGCEVKKIEEVTDSEKFASEYSVKKENPYYYSNMDEILEIFKSKTGIILFANPDCEKCEASIEILTKALTHGNISKVHYYNPKKISEANTKEYQELMKILEKYTELDNNNQPYLSLPDVYFVKDGNIIGHNNDMATMQLDNEEFLTDKQKEKLIKTYEKLISKYNILECTTC